MKKLFSTILVLGFLLSGNAYAEDKFIGKWINDNTNSVYEIKKDGKNYDMYLLYSTKFFREYKNKIIGSFKKTNLGFKGNFIAIDLIYPWTELNSKASYKLKGNKILTTVKGKIRGKKFKFKGSYTKASGDIKYTYGEELFGIQIGKTIDNYKLGSEVLDGDEKFQVTKTQIYPPNKNEEFGVYLIGYSKTTKQVTDISAYLKINSQQLSYKECQNSIRPYKNYVNDKYSEKYTIESGKIISTVLKKSGREVYSIFVDCEKRYGSYVGFISLGHLDLRMLDHLADSDNKTKKKF
jgi:hypothetical protein